MRLCGTDSQLSSEPITSEEQSISHEQKTLKRNALLMFFLTAKSVKIKRFQLFNTSLGWSSSISWWGGQTYDNHLVGVQVKLQPQINFSYWTWLSFFAPASECKGVLGAAWVERKRRVSAFIPFISQIVPHLSKDGGGAQTEQRWNCDSGIIKTAAFVVVFLTQSIFSVLKQTDCVFLAHSCFIP